MKTKITFCAICFGWLVTSCLPAFAQGTAFTYQGRLNDGTSPANGSYDLTFSVWNAVSGPAQMGNTVTNPAVNVSNGLFTVTLNFGYDVFKGDARWLEIRARTNGVGGFTLLNPRQSILPTPYAMHAQFAGDIEPGSTVSFSGPVTFNYAIGQPFYLGPGVTNLVMNLNAQFLAGRDAGQFWWLGGNSGQLPSSYVLGTLDNNPVEFEVNAQRALRLEPNTNGAPNVIGGASKNFVGAGVVGAAINGGGAGIYFGSSYTNRVTADFGTVAGGEQNTSSGFAATVGGGRQNTSSASDATVGGGEQNTSSGASATVSGGYGNVSSGLFATVGGGLQNTNNGSGATVSGGTLNTSTGSSATVGGGSQNSSSDYATVSGGFQNTSSGFAATVAGGQQNIGSAGDATVGGGEKNTNSGYAATISGGYQNISSNSYATVGGGTLNFNSGASGTIGGGNQNYVTADYATVGGGRVNTAGNENAAVVGGYANTASGHAAFVGGGEGNQSTGDFSAVPGGSDNYATGLYSFAAGRYARANHDGSFVWADSPGVNFASTGANQFLIRAAGGVGIGLNAPQQQLSVAAGMNLDQNNANAGTVASALTFGSASGEGIASKRTAGANQYGLDFYTGAINRMSIANNGNVTLSPGSLFFGSQTRQMLNLWGSVYGIGVQANTLYNRCDALGGANAGFIWYKGGVHSDTYADPGGGTELMHLVDGALYVHGTYNNTSDRNAKENFTAVDSLEVLKKVAALPITRWNYKHDTATPHLGPVAQDFYAAFGVGPDDKHIATVDESGVALAAIQGLNQKLEQQRAQSKAKDAEIESLKQSVAELKRQIETLAAKK